MRPLSVALTCFEGVLSRLGFNKYQLIVLLGFPCLVLGSETSKKDIVSPEKSQQQVIPSTAFGSGFFQGGSRPESLQFLLAGNSVMPGTYRVDIYVNGDLNSRRDLDFSLNDAGDQVEPCLTLAMLQEFAIDLGRLKDSAALEQARGESCIKLVELIKEAEVEFDASRLRLNISVPQVYQVAGAQGYVDPALWDQGVNAAFSNYQLNLRRNKSNQHYDTSTYLGLQNGLNLGAWRLRNESSLTTSTGQPTEFNSNRNFAEHDVTVLKAQFALGELYSRDSLFDSVRYRGVQLVSDDAMLADSERGYAPVIRGVAESNATVEVYQNDYLLYSTTVTPGPFALTNIYPSGSNGDLEVIIIEADGRRRVTRQAFGNVPIMVRKGRLTFSTSAGKFHSNDATLGSPAFLSSAFAYGIGDNLTGVLGVQASEGFQAMSLGIGRNTFIGAVSLDLTQSSSTAQGQTSRGQSVRMLYSKTFIHTDTDFMLAAYRYSTENYRTLDDHVRAVGHDPAKETLGRSRARLDLTLQQRLGPQRQYGSAYLTASDQSYWNNSDRSQSISAGYSNHWQRLTYDIGFTRTLNTGNGSRRDSQLAVSLTLPLGQDSQAPRLHLRSTRDSNNQNNTQAGLSGHFDRASQYSLQAGNDSVGGSSGFASVGTETAVGRFDLGYGQGRDYSNLSLGASGSVVAHGGGFNFGRQVGESFALVEVPDTPGVGVSNHIGVRTGANGYAIVPTLQPYRLNWVSLDSSELGADVELENAVHQLVPRRGAVLHSRYQAEQGRRLQFQLYQADGSPLGFGARVEDAQGKLLAISDPYGKALTLLGEDQGVLTLKWDKQTCTAAYRLAPRDKALNFENADLKCD
ncbi:fimbria/pilus outer membrane usher protein [Pseudomonas sp. Fl5BN2]|uniref:fimbria/pilus outer membrane usher protein n=1 Tax=Pseudomonas sp. Fl5BN2 TaxID=2697652 RepID=UPI001378FF4C|nr:fimbria/pilus outer membrane usher protein [Pseudomonas sp. Fl5BN2]NBF05973.1 fimbria/pilus outer membrane usher protein [Pseudomonas sp. Fl5BN2]